MGKTRHFMVKLSNFRAENLPAMDRSGTSDPYLKINFDDYRKMST
eukprot:CAMPEP_0113883032 /NCGR_PEP_ID=MMETSP0780_2-20120614/9331_1 /TAXON_ID=652834 /ORGANISM="Palpitomonas bilix" /LENGTH=44 /DNA_ID=CAMNT_0000870205 /DNA_START=167 /DNA_END=298 /DNA_ORIENTATION=+ /assembly_acc=CAM_ASM_000599